MRVLYIDIESSPNIAHVWGLFRQTVSLAQLRESTRMICFAAKWRGEKRVHFFSEFHHGRDEMLKAAHQMLSEADAVVTYNGKGYDIPNLNREFVLAGMAPPAPFHSIDLLSTVRRRFRFASTKLDHVTRQLGLSGKVKNEGHILWVKCMAGDAKAWAAMRRYNQQDVVVLEELHNRVMPWITNGPNMRLFVEGDDDVCPSCGSGDLRKEGYRHTAVSVYQRYQCRACGHWSQGSKRLSGTDIRGFPS